MKNIRMRIIERLSNNLMKVFHIDEIKDLGTFHYLMTEIYKLKKEGWIVKTNKKFIFEFCGVNYLEGLYCRATAQDVANFIVRRYNWQLIPSRDFAMSLFGIGRECEVYSYISDKEDVYLEYNNTFLIIEHMDRSYFRTYTFNTLIVIELLKAIGTKDMNDLVLRKISSKLLSEEKKIILQEIKDKNIKYKDYIISICKY